MAAEVGGQVVDVDGRHGTASLENRLVLRTLQIRSGSRRRPLTIAIALGSMPRERATSATQRRSSLTQAVSVSSSAPTDPGMNLGGGQEREGYGFARTRAYWPFGWSTRIVSSA